MVMLYKACVLGYGACYAMLMLCAALCAPQCKVQGGVSTHDNPRQIREDDPTQWAHTLSQPGTRLLLWLAGADITSIYYEHGLPKLQAGTQRCAWYLVHMHICIQ